MKNDQEERNNNNLNEMYAEQITLKVLFGAMYGCDFHLPKDNYFVITQTGVREKNASSTTIDIDSDNAVNFGYKTLYLPFEEEGPNFLLKLSDNDSGEYKIDIFHKNEGVKCYDLKNNMVFSHDGICFAVKREGEEWSNDIITFLNKKNDDSSSTGKIKILKFVAILTTLIIIGGGLFIYGFRPKENETDVTFLAGIPPSVKVITSKVKHKAFILTKSVDDFNFMQGAFFNKKENVVIVYLPALKKNIIDELYTAGNPVIQIDFSVPQHPVLYTSKKIDVDTVASIKNFLLDRVPFADDIAFVECDKAAILAQARQGLERMNILFQLINTPGGYALIVQESLDDHQLFALNKFIKEFHTQWGDKFINFSISLNEGFLKGKSYLEPFSHGGYVFLSPHHWYIPSSNSKGEFINE
ncbi:TPA: hypothetical protein J1413_004861 [Escherichia coli]|nr:hypothetical protein [Escherichia coli]HBA9523021.1 hypothetical protein [Escherichia coli]HBA9550985.1 hypothetical protein [Escherichia coli]HBA9560444.1 hypothetical protein [Escherichia coli]